MGKPSMNLIEVLLVSARCSAKLVELVRSFQHILRGDKGRQWEDHK